MKKNYQRYIFLTLLTVSQVYANVYDITPTKITLSSKQTISTVEITNSSGETGLLQLSLFDWQQINGKDIYQVSHDILFTPPIFKLPPHKTQLIRFSLKHPIFLAEEKDYRLHIKEVEQPKQKKLGKLYFIMDFSLPLFVQPERIVEKFNWSAQRIDAKHTKLKLYNNGNVNLLVTQWQLLPYQKKIKKHSTFTYVLPHQSHTWVVETKPNVIFTDIKSNINGQNKKSILHMV